MELRIPPVIVVLACALSMWLVDRFVPLANTDFPGAGFVALAVAIAGIVICALGVISFQDAGTTTNPLDPSLASMLVISGIYRVSRNPMYLGFALLLLAWGIQLRSMSALLVLPAFILYMNRFQIAPEERALLARFGQAYADYRQATRRWI